MHARGVFISGDIATASASITIDESPACITGLEGDLTSGKILAYPNPSSNRILFLESAQFKNETMEVAVYDALGNQVMRFITASDQNVVEVNLEYFKSGYYYISVNSIDTRIVMFSKKIVLN